MLGIIVWPPLQLRNLAKMDRLSETPFTMCTFKLDVVKVDHWV